MSKPWLRWWAKLYSHIRFIISLDFLIHHADIFGKKWSLKQRVVVTAVISCLILFVALLIGGTVYGLGRVIGVFETQSMHRMIYESIKHDPAFWEAAEAAAKKLSCKNTHFGFHYTYLAPLEPVKLPPKDICTQVIIPTGSSHSGLSLKVLPMSKTDALATLLPDLKELETDSFNHVYVATVIRAFKRGGRFTAVTINPTPEKTYLFEYYPAAELQQELVFDLIASFRID